MNLLFVAVHHNGAASGVTCTACKQLLPDARLGGLD